MSNRCGHEYHSLAQVDRVQGLNQIALFVFDQLNGMSAPEVPVKLQESL
jgi:hypothetical protein